jgi:hypothetical protein
MSNEYELTGLKRVGKYYLDREIQLMSWFKAVAEVMCCSISQPQDANPPNTPAVEKTCQLPASFPSAA